MAVLLNYVQAGTRFASTYRPPDVLQLLLAAIVGAIATTIVIIVLQFNSLTRRINKPQRIVPAICVEVEALRVRYISAWKNTGSELVNRP